MRIKMLIQVPVFHNSIKDEAVWINNQGKMVQFSIRNVWKDKIDEGQEVSWFGLHNVYQSMPL
jgi:hypothetical protein